MDIDTVWFAASPSFILKQSVSQEVTFYGGGNEPIIQVDPDGKITCLKKLSAEEFLAAVDHVGTYGGLLKALWKAGNCAAIKAPSGKEG